MVAALQFSDLREVCIMADRAIQARHLSYYFNKTSGRNWIAEKVKQFNFSLALSEAIVNHLPFLPVRFRVEAFHFQEAS